VKSALCAGEIAALAAGVYGKPTPSQGVIFPQPLGLPFFITTAAKRR